MATVVTPPVNPSMVDVATACTPPVGKYSNSVPSVRRLKSSNENTIRSLVLNTLTSECDPVPASRMSIPLPLNAPVSVKSPVPESMFCIKYFCPLIRLPDDIPVVS
jgi:hypothetical protein